VREQRRSRCERRWGGVSVEMKVKEKYLGVAEIMVETAVAQTRY